MKAVYVHVRFCVCALCASIVRTLRPNPLNEKLTTLGKDRHLSRESGLAL